MRPSVLNIDCPACGAPAGYPCNDPAPGVAAKEVCGDRADVAQAVRPSVIDRVWLCPVHAEEFWVPHGGICPSLGCDRELRVYWAADEVRPLTDALERIANAAELQLGFVAQRQIADEALRRFSGEGAS